MDWIGVLAYICHEGVWKTRLNQTRVTGLSEHVHGEHVLFFSDMGYLFLDIILISICY